MAHGWAQLTVRVDTMSVERGKCCTQHSFSTLDPEAGDLFPLSIFKNCASFSLNFVLF